MPSATLLLARTALKDGKRSMPTLDSAEKRVMAAAITRRRLVSSMSDARKCLVGHDKVKYCGSFVIVRVGGLFNAFQMLCRATLRNF